MNNREYKYKEIENYIMENIYNGTFKTNTFIPTQYELCKRFNCSRMTVDKALNNVEEKGLIRSIQGSGCLVTVQKSRTNDSRSFTETYSSSGKTSTKLLAYSLKQASDFNDIDLCHKLMVKPNCPIHYIKRVQSVNGVPTKYSIHYIAASRIEINDISVLNGSIYNYVENVLKIKLRDCKMDVVIVKPDEEVKKILNINNSDPVAYFRESNNLYNGLPWQYEEAYQLYDTIHIASTYVRNK